MMILKQADFYYIYSVGGTTGAIFTCPLEVVKTRLQSSNSGFPTCDGPSCDYVPIKSKKDKPKLNVGYGNGGTQVGAGNEFNRSGRRDYSTLTSKNGATTDWKHLKYHAVPKDHLAAEKGGGLIRTTIPDTSNSMARKSSGFRYIFSSSREIGVNSFSNNGSGTKTDFSTIQNKAYMQQQPSVNASYRHRYFKPWDAIVRCSSTVIKPAPPPKTMNVFQCLKFIYLTEGVFGLWKGLGPNLMGVAPSRAIYFWIYSTSKKKLNAALPRKNRDTPFVHVISAMSAGFSTSTTTNPIWLIKTRLQLDRATSKRRLTVKKTIIDIYREAVSKYLGASTSGYLCSRGLLYWVADYHLNYHLSISFLYRAF